ncbi:hypothetical protein Q5P01_012289 [Channa striata]|uniref:Uncharacterized protein n=1 Tax=Channa striata TaxID=64152 RepID=A0AA88MRG6_CHASR|nr:hypothetical protein Q5P01_012289 [Channa striata]
MTSVRERVDSRGSAHAGGEAEAGDRGWRWTRLRKASRTLNEGPDRNAEKISSKILRTLVSGAADHGTSCTQQQSVSREETMTHRKGAFGPSQAFGNQLRDS